jgi:hypothetical protein
MIYEQSAYPPTYYLELTGTHTETTYRRETGTSFGDHNSDHHRHDSSGDTRTENTITDFLIRINITHLLSNQGPTFNGETQLLADNEKGYRGGVIKRLTPSIGSPGIQNQHEELKAWCDKYVSDPSNLKLFTLKREIINHDTTRLEGLIRSAITSTNYRGKVQVSFPITYERVTVYSPTAINRWRLKPWIRWFFYLTFLWIFSWLYLFLATARYEVVKVVFRYADVSPRDALHGIERRPTVMGEVAWFKLWEKSIRRAALSRMNCAQFDLDDEYRIATEELASRGEANLGDHRVGNSYSANVVGLFGVGTQFAGHWQQREGWGYDC